MKVDRASACVLLSAVVIGSSGVVADGAVVYRETFGHTGGATPITDPGPQPFDWAVHSGAATGTWRNVGTTSVTNQANVNASGGRSLTIYPAGTPLAGMNSRDGTPGDTLLNVNAGAPTSFLYDISNDANDVNDANPKGNAYISGTGWGAATTDRRALFWTPEYSVNQADFVPGTLSVSWYQGNGNALDPIHAVVRIGSQWYVTSTGFTNAAVTLATFFSNAELKTVNVGSASWSLLTFDGTYNTSTDLGTDSTVGLAIGASVGALPAGIIDAFGIYSHDPQTTGAANRRFDTFTIEGELIPEPTAMMLVPLGFMLLSCRRRHRRDA